jgi:4-carboxymuconolactone decarboxylase
MTITEAARRNHEEVFPNHESTLKGTDPELVAIFDNSAFDFVQVTAAAHAAPIVWAQRLGYLMQQAGARRRLG